jgi:hypothetical protein
MCSISSGGIESTMRFRPDESGRCRKNSCQKPSDSSVSSSSSCAFVSEMIAAIWRHAHLEQRLVEPNDLGLEYLRSRILSERRRLHGVVKVQWCYRWLQSRCREAELWTRNASENDEAPRCLARAHASWGIPALIIVFLDLLLTCIRS